MAVNFGQKFRQSSDYLYDVLIRDLLDYAKDQLAYGKTVDASLSSLVSADAALDTRLDALEIVGIWTPGLRFGGATTGITYSIQGGQYRKIGRFVHAEMDLKLSNRGSATGVAELTGLPFATANVGSWAISYYENMQFASAGMFQGLAHASTISQLRLGTTTNSLNLTEQNFNNASRIIATISYLTAS